MTRYLPMLIAAGALAAATPAVGADHFAERVAQAKLAEGATAGTAYQKALWAQIGTATGAAYKTCLAASKPQDKTPFTLVFDLDHHGAPRDLAAQPPIPVAQCMVKTFAGWTFPAPPTSPKPYPLEIEFSVAGEGNRE